MYSIWLKFLIFNYLTIKWEANAFPQLPLLSLASEPMKTETQSSPQRAKVLGFYKNITVFLSFLKI